MKKFREKIHIFMIEYKIFDFIMNSSEFNNAVSTKKFSDFYQSIPPYVFYELE